MYEKVILAGVLISLFYSEWTGLSAGLIIPGYLVLYLHSPLRIICTLAVAATAVLLCKALSSVTILYGRRRFAMLLVLTYGISAITELLGVFSGGIGVIGILIPGILAREFDRQGFCDTLLSLLITMGALTLLLTAVGYPVFDA